MMPYAYAVIAEFAVSAEHKQEFLEICAYDARESVEKEPGCQSFAAHTSDEDAAAVMLYETYADKAAFDFHLTTPHFAVFDEALKRLGVTTTQVRFFNRQ